MMRTDKTTNLRMKVQFLLVDPGPTPACLSQRSTVTRPWTIRLAYEIFGPGLSIARFASMEQAIEIVNATDFGLAATIVGTDIERD